MHEKLISCDLGCFWVWKVWFPLLYFKTSQNGVLIVLMMFLYEAGTSSAQFGTPFWLNWDQEARRGPNPRKAITAGL